MKVLKHGETTRPRLAKGTGFGHTAAVEVYTKANWKSLTGGGTPTDGPGGGQWRTRATFALCPHTPSVGLVSSQIAMQTTTQWIAALGMGAEN
jgi:hypothetical protein